MVHGGWHGAWCWKKTVPLLNEAGHEVIAPDLPGHGANKTNYSRRVYEQYAPFIGSIVERQTKPIILLGHSSGGAIITEVAKLFPRKIKTLIYLSAFLLPVGLTPPEIMLGDSASLLPACLQVDVKKEFVSVKRECAKEVFYADCTDEDAEWAINQLIPEPIVFPASSGQPEIIRNIEQIPRVYIECLQDKALSPRMQKKMYTAVSCRAVYSLPTSHSPFISAPEKLVEHLLDSTNITS